MPRNRHSYPQQQQQVVPQQQANVPLYHGSHACPLTATSAQALLTLAPLACGICQAAMIPADYRMSDPPTQMITCCHECKYYLCQKCFSIPETHFSTPQYIIRSPAIPLEDALVSIRTRPRTSAHILGPLTAGTIVEVICSSVSAEDGLTHCRQRFGGWIRCDDVLTVAPSENSAMDAVIRQHLQHQAHGGADVLSKEDISRVIQDATELLQSNPAFGVAMASLVLLSVQLTVTAQSADSELLTAGEKFCKLAFVQATSLLEELVKAEKFASTSSILPAVMGRAAAVLFWLHDGPSASRTPFFVLSAGVRVLSAALLQLDSPAITSLTPDEEMAPLWSAVATENITVEGNLQTLCQLVLSAMYSAVSYGCANKCLDVSAVGSCAACARRLPLQQAVQPIMLLCIDRISQEIEAETDLHARHNLQQALIDADVLESVMRILKHSKEEGEVLSASRLLADVVLENETAGKMLSRIAGQTLIAFLSQPRSAQITNGLLDALCSFTHSEPAAPDQGEGDDAPTTPCLGSDNFQWHRVSVFKSAQGPVVLCTRCRDYCCTQQITEEYYVSLPQPPQCGTTAPLVCTCPSCSHRTVPAQPPVVSSEDEEEDITEAQTLSGLSLPEGARRLASHPNMANLLLGKIRVYRFEVVNSAARLATRLGLFTNSALANEMFWCLVEFSMDELQDHYADALLFLSRLCLTAEGMDLLEASITQNCYTVHIASYLMRCRQEIARKEDRGAICHLSPQSQPSDLGLTPSTGLGSFAGSSSGARLQLQQVTSPLQLDDPKISAELFPPLPVGTSPTPAADPRTPPRVARRR